MIPKKYLNTLWPVTSWILWLVTGVLAQWGGRVAEARYTFRFQVDEKTEIDREVETFHVVKAIPGYVMLQLSPYQPDLSEQGVLIQLGRKDQITETPVNGEATWMACVKESNRVIARLPSSLKPWDVPVGMVVLSVRPNDHPISPMEGALEAAKVLRGMGNSEDAQSLLSSMIEDHRYQTSKCALLKALLEIQTPASPTQGEALPSGAEKTLRDVLENCTSTEGDAASRLLAKWTLDRLKSRESSITPSESETIINDALRLIGMRSGGDELRLVLAQILYREGKAEEGMKTLEPFDGRYAASPLRSNAQELRERLKRHAPAAGYRSLGAGGTGSIRTRFNLKGVTTLFFDPQGNLALLDGASSPPKLEILGYDLTKNEVHSIQTIDLNMDWKPIAATRDSEGVFYLIDSGEDQVVAVDARGVVINDREFARRGEGWKLRSPKELACFNNQEILVLDAGSEKLYRYGTKGNYIGSIDLDAAGLGDAIALTSSPEGKVLIASELYWNLFDVGTGPGKLERALRGRSFELKVNRAGLCRWRYIYLFDQGARRLEKFRYNGEWLTTVIDCARDNIRKPGPWAINSEGDIVIYDKDSDSLLFYILK